MCGILGFVGKNTLANRQLINNLMLQLSLRGTHATGYAWKNLFGSIVSVSKTVPPSGFPVEHLLEFDDTKEIRMIGHTRYSTSDLKFNQPIQLEMKEAALVMNGVLSQEGPETWPRSKWSYETRNDAEIALHYSMMGKRGDLNGSFAICELGWDALICYRNGWRPLYIGRGDDFKLVASTWDAIERCGVHVVGPLKPGRIIDLVSDRNVGIFDAELEVQPQPEHVFKNLHCNIWS